MQNRIFNSVLLFGLAAIPAFSQRGLYLDEPMSMKMRSGSIYSILGDSSTMKIDPKKVLPIGIAVKNNNMPKQISLRVEKYVTKSKYGPKPIMNGFKVVGISPSKKILMSAHECRIFRINIQINTDKHQIVQIQVLDDNDNCIYSGLVTINDPKYNHRDYHPVEESDLCKSFSPDPNGPILYKSK